MKAINITHRDKFFKLTKKSTRLVVILGKKTIKEERGKKKKPVKLFNAECTGVVVVYLVNCMFEDLPRLVRVIGIYRHRVDG